MLPSIYLTFWWIYSILQGNNESAAYLSLFIAASIPIPLIFILLDKISNKSPLLQLAIDSAAFIGFCFIIKMTDEGAEWWGLLLLSLIYSAIIYMLATDRLRQTFRTQ